MSEPTTPRTRMTRPPLRISASSVTRVALPRFAPCVLDLLDHVHRQAHVATEAVT